MAVAYATFIVQFPEFATGTQAHIEAKIAEAERRLSVGALGDRYDDAVSYLTAHLLSLSPYGNNARKANATDESIYMAEYRRILMGAVHRVSVSGVDGIEIT